jgi:uncharacterized tellurite resistance protein B-like protein
MYNIFISAIPLSNNLSEIAIRPVAIARKNYLFSDTPRDAEANTLIFSIIETATTNNLDPYEFSVHIFKNLLNVNFNEAPELLDDYMPWSGKLPENCYTNKQKTNDPRRELAKMTHINFVMDMAKAYLDGEIDCITYSLDFPYEAEKKI